MKKFFPVHIQSVSDKECILGSCNQEKSTRDQLYLVALNDKTQNGLCPQMNLKKFMESNHITIEDAVALTNVTDKTVAKCLKTIVTKYINYFSSRNPPVPSSAIELVRIKCPNRDVKFNLHIEEKSKERYASSVARVIAFIWNISHGKNPASCFQISDTLTRNFVRLWRSVSDKRTAVEETIIGKVHAVLSHKLLGSVATSKDETLLIENIFKVLLSGYSQDSVSKRARGGSGDDASYVAAALQYVLHICALGEFMVPPVGFGTTSLMGSTNEEERRNALLNLIDISAASPEAFIRDMLKRTRGIYSAKETLVRSQLAISNCERTKVSFAPCFDHAPCGLAENIHLPLNSVSKGSLGYAFREMKTECNRILRQEIMLFFNVDGGFFERVHSSCDRISSQTPGYFFGNHNKMQGDAMEHWTETFATYMTKRGEVLSKRAHSSRSTGSSVTDGSEVVWDPISYGLKWLHTCQKFMDLLLVLLLIGGGGPPRGPPCGTELVHMRVRNTATAHRNIFLYKGRLCSLTTYSKGRNRGFLTPVARFWDHETSRMLVQFIVFVKPLMDLMVGKAFGRHGVEVEWLFTRNGNTMSE